jgi:lipoate-protein ligase A
MVIVERPQTDPYFNIAAEEYLLKNLNQGSFMLWQNDPSVIIGKHQNALAEFNHSLVRQRNIPVIRRIRDFFILSSKP